MTGPTHADAWFAVLPDSAAAQARAAELAARPAAEVALRHASGRPCLIGVFAERSLVRARAGPVQVAVIGCCPVTATDLGRRIARVAGVESIEFVEFVEFVEEAVAGLPGSFHVVAAARGAVRVRGDAAGLRRVFHTREGIAADRADVLAALLGAELDVERLVAGLLTFMPPSLAGSLWKGVVAVPPGQATYVPADGPVRLTRWWRPPEPTLSLQEAAPLLGEALADAVACRVRAGEPIAADLSGGLDSTPLCFLAQDAARQRGARLITVGVRPSDPAHDDWHWADRAIALLDGEHVGRSGGGLPGGGHLGLSGGGLPGGEYPGLSDGDLPGGEHLRLGDGDLPGWYDDVATPVPGLDAPMARLSLAARTAATAALLARHGARVHLTGHGGDEVTLPPPSYLHDLARLRPLAWWPHLRRRRAQARWPLVAGLAALAERRTYPAWLLAQADLLTAPYPPPGRPDLGWEPPLRLPSWTHPDAAAAAAHLLRQAAAGAHPLAGLRAQHVTVAGIHDNTADLRQAQILTARHGAVLHAPFLDTRVIEICLATRLDQRALPGVYKPLTVAAMSGRVPGACLRRTTKGEFSTDAFDGLRRHRDQLLALADDSRLAALGLADPSALRQACLRTPADSAHGWDIDTFIAVENWLRALPARADPPSRSGPSSRDVPPARKGSCA